VQRSGSAKKAFTLIEVMLAVGLFAIIATTALAPLMFTVRSLKSAQEIWLKDMRSQRYVKQIFSEVRSCVRQGAETSVRVERASDLNVSEDSRLAVFSLLPLKQGRPAAVCVYRIFKEDKLKKVEGGLYRFEFALPLADELLLSAAANRQPINIDMEKLTPEKGKRIIPSAVGMKVYVFRDGHWEEEYSGLLPEALKIAVKLEKGNIEYEEYFGAQK